nr:MAG: hypothetical protein [Bacteriophage sp.]
MEVMNMTFNAKQIHRGQYRTFGDFFRVWEIETDMPKETVIDKCFSELFQKRLPEEKEWRREVRYGCGHFGDADYFFRGYYSIETIEGGFRFTVCEPYED